MPKAPETSVPAQAAPRKAVWSGPIVPVTKGIQDGCESWVVTLTKVEDWHRFGFSHASAKTKFCKLRADVAPPSEKGPERLTVKKLSGTGLLDAWNEVHPEAAVAANDRIVEVSGAKTVDEMVAALRADSIVMRVLRYPEIFEVTLTKREGMAKYGFKFEKPNHAVQQELRITNLSPTGLLEDSNRRNIAQRHYHLVAQPGMRVVAANDKTGDATAIADVLRDASAQSVTVKIRRCELTSEVKQRLRQHVQLLGSLMKKASLTTAAPPMQIGS